MDHPDECGSVSEWKAAFALFTSVEAFGELNRANLESGHQRMRLMMAPRSAGVPHVGSAEGQRLTAIKAALTLRRELAFTCSIAAAMMVLALATGYWSGAVAPSLPWHWGKVYQTAGALFGLWGTLLALRGPYKFGEGGKTLADGVHALVFTVILTIGGALAMLGTLISG